MNSELIVELYYDSVCKVSACNECADWCRMNKFELDCLFAFGTIVTHMGMRCVQA